MLSDAFAQLVIKEKLSVDRLTEVLKHYQLSALLPDILSHLKRQERKNTENDTLFIASPFELSEKVVKQIKNEIGSHEDSRVLLLENKDLLAGYIASYKETRINKSAELVLKRFINNH